MKTIDASNLSCPQPLIMTKNALEKEDNIVTIVDNKVAVQNIEKFCKKMNYTIETEEKDNKFYLTITKTGACAECDDIINAAGEQEGKVYLIGKNILGSGSEELGKMLMKGFVYTLTQVTPLPKKIIFLNSGVKIACEGSDSIDDLTKLNEQGTQIVSCGTCLDYYKLTDKLKVGEVTNMYDIVETINDKNGVITIG